MAANLRAQTQEQLEQKQAAWAAKKWTWVIDDKEGCVAGEIIKEGGNDITVRLVSGQVRGCATPVFSGWAPARAHTWSEKTGLSAVWPGRGGTGAHRDQGRH